MITESRDDVISPAIFNPGTNTILGTTVSYDQFDTTYHWEGLAIVCHLVCNATPPSTLTLDGVLNLIANVKVEFNFGGIKTAVSFSGIGLLEYCANIGLNTDAATLNLIAEHVKGTPALIASNTYRLVYHVPFVHPRVSEPLLSSCLVPVPIHDASPKLTLQFSSAAAMFGAGTLDTVLVQIVPIRREVPQVAHDAIMKAGGYLPFDLVEYAYTPGTGVSGDQHIPVNQPGAYAALQLRMYKGGASVTRDDPSASTTAGSETIWSVQTANKVYRKFLLKTLQAQNGWPRVLNSAAMASSPVIAGKLAANTQYSPPNSLILDFLGGGNGISDINELGGCLDCFLPANPGQRMEIVANWASVATNSSTMYIGGHRFLEQASVGRFQKL